MWVILGTPGKRRFGISRHCQPAIEEKRLLARPDLQRLRGIKKGHHPGTLKIMSTKARWFYCFYSQRAFLLLDQFLKSQAINAWTAPKYLFSFFGWYPYFSRHRLWPALCRKVLLLF